MSLGCAVAITFFLIFFGYWQSKIRRVLTLDYSVSYETPSARYFSAYRSSGTVFGTDWPTQLECDGVFLCRHNLSDGYGCSNIKKQLFTLDYVVNLQKFLSSDSPFQKFGAQNDFRSGWRKQVRFSHQISCETIRLGQ